MKKQKYPPVGGTLDDLIIDQLKADEDFRYEYLKSVLKEKDVPLLALKLKPLVDVLGGIGKLAKKTGLGRQNLYKVLSGKVRPEFSTISKIINFAGYDLSLEKKPAGKKHGRPLAVAS